MKQPDVSLEEPRSRVADAKGLAVSRRMMCCKSQRSKLPPKNKTLHDSQRDTLRVKQAINSADILAWFAPAARLYMH